MLRRTVRLALAGLMAASVTLNTFGSQPLAQANQVAGPPYDFRTEIIDNFVVVPLGNAARILRGKHGYVYEAGRQDTRLVLRRVAGGIRFADTRTARLTELPRGCRERNVRVGVAAVCRVPAGVTVARPLLIEVWPRLGDDVVNSVQTPAWVAVSVLGDAGNDVVRFGPGPDFFNGAFGDDRAFGGAGNDWIRTGTDNDVIFGGAGDDLLVGVAGADVISGGYGDDRVGGGDGNDRLRGDAGRDFVLCGAGRDSATIDASDSVLDCEIRTRG